jgi:hypothetical protein
LGSAADRGAHQGLHGAVHGAPWQSQLPRSPLARRTGPRDADLFDPGQADRVARGVRAFRATQDAEESHSSIADATAAARINLSPLASPEGNDAVSVRVGLVRREHACEDVPGRTGHSRACRRYLSGVEGQHRSTQQTGHVHLRISDAPTDLALRETMHQAQAEYFAFQLG